MTNLPKSDLVLSDVKLKVRHQIDNKVEEDTSCNNTYMLCAMDRVGVSFHKSYHWVDSSQKWYLVMDNTNRQSTNGTIKEYTSMLESKYNI